MGLLVLILVAAVIWLYFKTKSLQERADKAARMAKHLENKRGITPLATSQQEPVSIKAEKTNNRRESPRAISASLNTGIPELDGPGMYQRLTGQGPSSQAVYLLYSQAHNAYKVGHCKPREIASRIKQIQPEVPDVKLDGTAVFPSVNNAYNAEQGLLAKLSQHKYHGIHGRWSGATEWITKRPTGKPYLTKPSAVEDRYEREVSSPRETIKEPDIYTVYLLTSDKKEKFKVSWCKTTSLQEKIKREQRSGFADAFLLSRFSMGSRFKARAIAIDLSKKSGSFSKEGRKEIFGWTSNPSYLNQFKKWDPDGQSIE